MERLDKLLSQSGVASRKELRQIIRAGRVEVNGIRVTEPEAKVDNTAVIAVDGKQILSPGRIVLLFHKPAGVVTSTEDPRDKTVMECLPPAYMGKGLFPIGRLDKDTEGLLLLTNDGPLGHHLTSPRHHVEKCYYAQHEGTVSGEDIQAFSSGITLRDGTVCLPAILKPLAEGESEIVIREGKYHQVRRMMASRGMHVTYLKRIRMGEISLGELPVGECRPLSEAEIASLE